MAVWVLTRQHQCLGSQVISRKRKKVWGKPREKSSRTQWIFIDLSEGGSSKVSSSGICPSSYSGRLSSPSAQPGSPSEKEMGKDQCTGSGWHPYAPLRCGCCELSPGQSPSRTECPDGKGFSIPSWTECPCPSHTQPVFLEELPQYPGLCPWLSQGHLAVRIDSVINKGAASSQMPTPSNKGLLTAEETEAQRSTETTLETQWKSPERGSWFESSLACLPMAKLAVTPQLGSPFQAPPCFPPDGESIGGQDGQGRGESYPESSLAL